MPRTESECTIGSCEEEEVSITPILEVGLPVGSEDDDELSSGKTFMTLRERRQIKLGLRRVLPLNVLIPHGRITEKNKRWYEALKKVWHHTDPWQSFHLDTLPEQPALRHRYNPIKQKWYQDEVTVKMETKPFNRGAMRQCYRLKKLSTFSKQRSWKHAGNYVAKKYMESVDRSVYFEDVKLQMDAKLWGDEYNRHNPPKKIDIFQMYVIELVREEGSPLFHLEHFIEGEYIKYNSNSGFVEDTKQCRHTPQAFSHFTFERSGHELIVVDIQGVGDLYTDPQIHTMDGLQYGDGNLGTKGMALFFRSHECNEICRGMGLAEFDLSPAERDAIASHHATSPSSVTEVNTRAMGHVVSPSSEDRHDLKKMLSNSRMRASSSVSDASSTAGDDESTKILVSPRISIDSGLPSSEYSPTGNSGFIEEAGHMDKNSEDGSELSNSFHHRSRFYSMSSDNYDTSEYSNSVGASITKTLEQKFGLPKRASNVFAENLLRGSDDFHLGDSILGQVHHDLAKYHEIGRFALDGNEDLIDWESALFHEENAADLGIPEAITTMAKIYLHLPHDVLVSCTVPETEENTNKGVDFMAQAAAANDRASILYMAKAFETGNGLGTLRQRSHKEATHWYQIALQTLDHDDHGEFDATMSDPNYLILAKQAELFLAGEFDLDADPSRAGELYTEAADEAMTAMKGRLANQYYMKAEEAWSLVEEE
ncbi:eukaryotic elongation factor 2 kinase-like isoform X2 [Watersipora subatra]|uniref:eukaryotic elongation factor 2 kinase-like isoform X2 n=1 Tax=Watersipora subatra TaxID=2589382 RepID=UPI00355C57CB